MPDSISARDRVAWSRIRYASVWEDADVLCDALAPAAGGGRLLTIASGGDNALAMLTLPADEVIAVDLNPAQLACLELRVAAFRALDDGPLLAFLGVDPATDRLQTYAGLRASLSVRARGFWDANLPLVETGVIHVGRFERYLRSFRKYVLPWVHGRRTLDGLLEQKSLAEQRRFYDEVWDTARWRWLFRIFFSRAVMGRAGRDPALFDHVEGSVAERLLARTGSALSEIPTSTNPYLTYIMTGNYPAGARPRYLRPEHIPTIRERLDRLSWVHGGVEAAGEGPYAGFNLSDVFEYMTPAEHERVYGELLRRSRPGARLIYWNMLAPRACPDRFLDRVRPLADLASDLHRRDRAFFYQALHVDEVMA